MIADLIRTLVTHLSLVLFVAALAVATALRPRTAEQYLSWLLLLAVGADLLWAGLFHVFLPQTAAQFIGWQVSPFQFEVGVADIAAGVMSMLAFRASLSFKTAAVCYVVLFYAGVIIGHIDQAMTVQNFAPGNFGMLLLLTAIKLVLLLVLLRMCRKQRNVVA